MSSTQTSLSWYVNQSKSHKWTCCMTDLEGEWRDGLPHVEGLSNRPLGVLLAHFRREVGNTARNRKENLTKSSIILNHTHTLTHTITGRLGVNIGSAAHKQVQSTQTLKSQAVWCFVCLKQEFSVVFRHQWLSVLRLEWLQHEELQHSESLNLLSQSSHELEETSLKYWVWATGL